MSRLVSKLPHLDVLSTTQIKMSRSILFAWMWVYVLFISASVGRFIVFSRIRCDIILCTLALIPMGFDTVTCLLVDISWRPITDGSVTHYGWLMSVAVDPDVRALQEDFHIRPRYRISSVPGITQFSSQLQCLKRHFYHGSPTKVCGRISPE